MERLDEKQRDDQDGVHNTLGRLPCSVLVWYGCIWLCKHFEIHMHVHMMPLSVSNTVRRGLRSGSGSNL